MQIIAVTLCDCWTRAVRVTMYSSAQSLSGLPRPCYVKPWAPCTSAQLCRHPLQACCKHSPLRGQRAAALLSLAKQLRAPAASTVVTRVKRALLLTHEHMQEGLPQWERQGLSSFIWTERGWVRSESLPLSCSEARSSCTHLQRNMQETGGKT